MTMVREWPGKWNWEALDTQGEVLGLQAIYRFAQVEDAGLHPRRTLKNLDLATFFVLRREFFEQESFRKDGTRPFAALDLLSADLDERLKPLCRHDVESVLWCIWWYCVPCWEWDAPSSSQAGVIKEGWLKKETRFPTALSSLRNDSGFLFRAVKRAFFKGQSRFYEEALEEEGDSDTDLTTGHRSPYATQEELIKFFNIKCPCPVEGNEWEWQTFWVGKTAVSAEGHA